MLVNTVGVIDSDYYNNEKNGGEIFVKFHNYGPDEITIPAGEGMVQCIFSKFLITDDDDAIKRNVIRDGGIGSTSK
jgi:dUTP pyrophosphatase